MRNRPASKILARLGAESRREVRLNDDCDRETLERVCWRIRKVQGKCKTSVEVASLQNIRFPSANTMRARTVPVKIANTIQFPSRGSDLGSPRM